MESLRALPILDIERLIGQADQLKDQYGAAQPYPNILLERFIEADAVQHLIEEFPSPEASVSWRQLSPRSSSGEHWQHNKLGLCSVTEMGPSLRELILEMNSGSFIRFLERLTGITGLLPDPKLQGGGIHQVLPGGVLGVHADFTRHRHYQLDRRVNVLVYLNPDWQDEWGGHLELWDPDMQSCGRRIRPLAGRCVIFNTSDKSFHGHPEVVSCPAGHTRKSIALYYYTRGREDADVEPTRATEWQKLPEGLRPDLE